ncbi:hypothetical protein [Mobiluncus holmesii]|uniref:hypothetical protein n=1 Tax=Mobiluncus holmesii TaxID=144178 RepID=UPI000DFDC08D|nr:hypothetical protein [Mobiluncus holmesii]STY88196.1 Uncharacterised protein [Mobiluncus holmesii]
MAAYKARVRSGWDQVAVKHVDAKVGDVATVGDSASFYADVQLGHLHPEDVEVQLLLGRVTSNDDLSGFEVLAMQQNMLKNGVVSYRLETPIDNAVRWDTRFVWCRPIP